MKSIFLPLAVLLFLLGLTPGPAHGRIKVIVTNDAHGQVVTDQGKGRIGYPLLKTYIRGAEKDGWQVFLLDSGDAFSGSAYAQVDHGRSIAELMGLMGYRVLTPGNHAFDHNEAENNPLYYSDVLLPILRKQSPGPVTVTARNLSLNNGPFPGVQSAPVVIFDESREPRGLRLVVAGILTPYVSRPSLAPSIPGYGFGELETPEATRGAIGRDLERALAPYDRPGDVVIVLGHVGYYGPDGDKDGRLTGLDLARVANVDFVADAHTHTAIAPRPVGSAVYGNGGRYLEHFLEITIDSDGAGRMELKSLTDLAALSPDEEIAKWLTEFERRQGLSDIVLELPETEVFSDRNLLTDNIPLGRLICRSMLRATGADMALHNVGGIRAGLPGGPVTMRELYDVLPFGDRLFTVSLSGREVLGLFEQGSSHGGRGLAQFYGLTAYVWPDGHGGFQCAGLRDLSGAPVGMEKQYRVAVNGFMAKRLEMASPADHGDLLQALKKELTKNPDLQLPELTSPLLIFSTRAEALKAWEENVQ